MLSKSAVNAASRIASALMAVGFTATSLANGTDSTAASSASPPTDALPYWAEGEPRTFVGARGIAGTGYGRIAASVGYGRPNWQWIGIDNVSTLTIDAVMAQSGLRGTYMIIDGMFTLRHTYSFAHRAILSTGEVTDGLLVRHGTSGAEYLAIDAGVSGIVPYQWLMGTWELSWVRPLTLRANELVLEEIQRVMIGPGGVWSVKLGAMVALTSRKRSFLGGMVEYLNLVGRDPGTVYRVGPSFWVSLTDHTELGGYLTWPLHGPDRLGTLNGMYGAVGVQYQFASGEPSPAIP